MAEIRLTRVEQGHTKIRNVPIAVTPEGFWCCPAPVMFQKTLKTQNPLNKPKSSSQPPKPSLHKKQTLETENKPAHSASKSALICEDNRDCNSEAPVPNPPAVSERTPRPKTENLPRKVSIEFGEPGTSDLRIVLQGKQGFSVKLSVHKGVLVDSSSFFAEKLSAELPGLPCLEIDDCEDVEIYVETVGLMYCKELKQRLIKQSVSRVLRILKIAEQLGFKMCMDSCLEYLEAVPWVGEEEEEKVVSSVLRLHHDGIGVTPILKRVASDNSKPCNKDTLSHILQLVLSSNDDRSRRDMKTIVLKLLKENNSNNNNNLDICNITIYASCKSCFVSLLSLFRQAAETDFANKATDVKEPVLKQISIEADNLTWLLEILADRQAADEFVTIWASQQELAALHQKLPVVTRYHVSGLTARVFVGIGSGDILPGKDTRHLLLQTWLEPLINDYRWLQHGCRPFDRKVVEEGIGRTILTLPLEDQQSILLGWLSTFLKAGGDSCPNLQTAFEVWWRRTFVRPYVEQGNNNIQHQQQQQQSSESSMT